MEFKLWSLTTTCHVCFILGFLVVILIAGVQSGDDSTKQANDTEEAFPHKPSAQQIRKISCQNFQRLYETHSDYDYPEQIDSDKIKYARDMAKKYKCGDLFNHANDGREGDRNLGFVYLMILGVLAFLI